MKEIFKNIIIKVLTWEARMVLARHKPMVVAITGVFGKTGTKDAVAAALSAKYSVRKSQKSFNSEFGVPLTVLGLPNAWNNPLLWLRNITLGFIKIFVGGYEQVLVLEVGADKPGDIASVASWLHADVVIITAVPEVPVHREYYADSAAVLKEKAQLVKALKSGGLLLTGDDERVATIGDSESDRVERVTYDKAEVLYNSGVPVGMEFTIGQNKVRAQGVLGSHQAYAMAFALAVAVELEVDEQEAMKALEKMQRTPGRMRLLTGKGGSTIIDDSYNSSPAALKAALKTLGELEVSGKKVAILGDMKELGDASGREHRRAGIQVAHIASELYTIGAQAKLLAESAIEEGLQSGNVHTYDEGQAGEIGKAVAQSLDRGDVVLVKGSQGGLRLEQAVVELIQESDKASELLVRQDKEWLKR